MRERENRPDYIHIDDIDEDRRCLNESLIRQDVEWVWSALFGTMDAGRGRFIIVGNLISKCSVLANLAANKKCTSLLSRPLTKRATPVWPDKWTKEEAQDYAETVGYRVWQKEMMHNPINAGSIFRHDWIRFKRLPRLEKYEMLVCYTDPSFKSSSANDYKASRLWGKIGTELHLIDCYVRQDTVSGMVRWLYDLYERTRDRVAISFFMEANFMQDIILDEFAAEGNLRGYQLPCCLTNERSPRRFNVSRRYLRFGERGYVFYNEALAIRRICKWVLSRLLLLSAAQESMMMRPMPTRVPFGICNATHAKLRLKPVLVPRPRPKKFMVMFVEAEDYKVVIGDAAFKIISQADPRYGLQCRV